MDQLEFFLYRGGSTSSEELVQEVVAEVKQFVYDHQCFSLSSQGYSGIPLIGKINSDSRRDDVSKTLHLLFRLSSRLEGLVFKISTASPSTNPFYEEAVKNDVVPQWVVCPDEFCSKLYGYMGVLHVIPPEVNAKHPDLDPVDLIRLAHQQTRNILVTESVKQRLDHAAARDFGMQRLSVNLPEEVAYIGKQRPDLLSCAIRELQGLPSTMVEKYEKVLDQTDRVMVHVIVNETDYKTVTEVADIESPQDIVSHRISLALLAFDDKYSNVQNGLDLPSSNTFTIVTDPFEREKLESLKAELFGSPHSTAHKYQMAKNLTTNKHRADCRKLFVDGVTSESDNSEKVSSADEDESYNSIQARKQVFKKKKQLARNDLGKKRDLAQVVRRSNVPELPIEEHELSRPANSGQLKNFERAVNGDDIYRESSEGDSLGEEEDMDLFVTKKKKDILNRMKNKIKQKNAIVAQELKARQEARIEEEEEASDDDEGGFDVADLLRAAPPLANTEDFDSI